MQVERVATSAERGSRALLRVDLKLAKAGMTLALPVRNPNNPARQLLAAGYVLNDEVLARLRDLGVREVIVRYPGLEALDKYITPAVLERRGALARQLEHTFDQIKNNASANIAYEVYLAELGGLLDGVLGNPAGIVFIEEAASSRSSMLEHASTVAYLSVLIGLKLDSYLIRQRRSLPPRYARMLGNLGLGAMLHDVGLLKLEPHVIERFEKTRSTDDAAWRAHTRIGYELVRGQVEPSAAVVVLDHHQRFDGGGFPYRRGVDGKPLAPSGERIHIFARIASVADVYDELRHPAEGEVVPSVRVIRQMLSANCMPWFDPQVLSAFVQVAPPYPPMSPVRLSDGRWAVPIEHNIADPCRPKVQVIPSLDNATPDFDPNACYDSPIVDLAEAPELQVVWSEGHDVSADNFKLPNITAGRPIPVPV